MNAVEGDPGLDLLLSDTTEVLADLSELARVRDVDPVAFRSVETLDDASDSLVAGERYLRGQGDAGEIPSDTALLVLLVRVQALRLSIGEARLRRRETAAAELHRSLTRLRGGFTPAELLREIPRELGRLGFSRSLLSDLRGTTWRATSAYAHQDESLAGALVELGSAMPGRVGREEPETQAVRSRAAVLVRDAQHRPRVHRELVTLGDTRDYAVAPVVVHGTVVGIVHVDRHSQRDVVDESDRDLLGLFADGVGLAFERARYQERLGALRHQFEAQAHDIDELLYATTDWASAPVPERPRPALVLDGPLTALTRRELEVLQHLAGGASNQDIADRLCVSPGTVKTHVKGLLRKLGAASRAEAAARFHSLTRG